MKVARKKAGETMEFIDVIIEVLDARLPEASSNPMIRELRIHRQRPCLKLLNKSDLADPAATKAWVAFYNAQKGVKAVAISSKKPGEAARVPALCQEIAPHRNDNFKPLRFDFLQPVYGFAAFLLLVGFLIAGRTDIALIALGIVAAKIVTDLVLNTWMVYVYRSITGDTVSSRFGHVIIATLLEPFSFQLLRQAGAVWGWLSFLTNRHRWGDQTRTSLGTAKHAAASASQLL